MKKTIYVQIIRGDPRVIEKENASIAENYEKNQGFVHKLRTA